MRPAHIALLACVALLLGSLVPGPDPGTSVVEVMASPYTCFGAKEGRGTFTAPFSGRAIGLRAVFLHGGVTCSENPTWLPSHWGCTGWVSGPDGLTMKVVKVVDDYNDEVVWPANGTAGFTGFTEFRGSVYTLHGHDANSPELRFKGPEVFVMGGAEYALVYSEVLYNFSTSDNSGKTCAEVYMTFTDIPTPPTASAAMQRSVAIIIFIVISLSLLFERGTTRSEAVTQKQQVRCPEEPLEEERVKDEHEREAANSQATALGQELQQVRGQLAGVQQEREAANSQATALGQELQQVRGQLAGVQQEREAANSQGTALMQELQQVREQLAEVQRVVNAAPQATFP